MFVSKGYQTGILIVLLENGIPQNVTHAYNKNEICPKFLEAGNQPTQR